MKHPRDNLALQCSYALCISLACIETEPSRPYILADAALRPGTRGSIAPQKLFNSFQAGAKTNPITGINATPINSPTTPDPAAVTSPFDRPGDRGQRVSGCFGSRVDGPADRRQADMLPDHAQ